MTIGEQIRKARLKQGLSQQGLATKCRKANGENLAISTIWKIEHGYAGHIDTLKAITEALGITIKI